MLAYLRRTLRRATSNALDKGASAVEYGLLVAAIAAAIVAVVFGLGSVVRKAFDDTCRSMQTPIGGDCKAPATGGGGTDNGTDNGGADNGADAGNGG